jgi:hypothetical protein
MKIREGGGVILYFGGKETMSLMMGMLATN